ncbi:hypothetical protein KUTeg_008088 [Tegillarca granosa]|uniref:F5/8 type C domain-containing protein n=1 Tax=Tegillarca granosa TaxID=220873 RepID=A0ABQ9FCE7_TEGGR|nr:hypothetical protein KUTeg_008088 [Tegillarca granosa]
MQITTLWSVTTIRSATSANVKYGKSQSTSSYTGSHLTVSPGQHGTGQPTAVPHACITRWSQWINKDNPVSDGMEREFMQAYEKKLFCGFGQLTQIECKTADVYGIPYHMTGDTGTICNIQTGLTCLNLNNHPSMCHDYKIRYFCQCSAQPTAQPLTDKNGNPIATPLTDKFGNPMANPLTDKFGNPIATPGPGSGGQPTAQPLTDKNGNPIATPIPGSGGQPTAQPLTDKNGNPIVNPLTDKFGNPIANPLTDKFGNPIATPGPGSGGQPTAQPLTDKNGNPIATPLTDKYGNPIANPLTDKFGNPIATPTQGSGGHPTAQPLTDKNGNPIATPLTDKYGNPIAYPLTDKFGNPIATPSLGSGGQPTAQPQTDKNGNPIATPFTDKYGHPIVNPATDKYGNPIATPIPGSGGQPTAQPQTDKNGNPIVNPLTDKFGNPIANPQTDKNGNPIATPGPGSGGQPTAQPQTDKNGNPIATPSPGSGGQPTAQPQTDKNGYIVNPLTDKFGNPIANPATDKNGNPIATPIPGSGGQPTAQPLTDKNGNPIATPLTDKFGNPIVNPLTDKNGNPIATPGPGSGGQPTAQPLTDKNGNPIVTPLTDKYGHPIVNPLTDKYGNPIATPSPGSGGQPTAQPQTDKNGNPIANPSPGSGGQPTAQPLTDKNGNPIATPLTDKYGHLIVNPLTDKYGNPIATPSPGSGGQPTAQPQTDKNGNPIATPSPGSGGQPTAQPLTDKNGNPIATPLTDKFGNPVVKPLTDKNGNPIVTPGPGSGGQPTAQPLTDKYGNPIATPHQGGSGHPSVAPSTCSSKWSSWINKDNPNVGDGEREFMTDTEKAKFCGSGRITKIECITADGGDIPYYSSGEIGTTCDVGTGLTCLNANNFPMPCSDYKVRYYCDCPEALYGHLYITLSVQPTAVPGQGQNGQPTPHPQTDKNGNPIATPLTDKFGNPIVNPLTDKNGNPIVTPGPGSGGQPTAQPLTDIYGNPIATPSPGSGGQPTAQPLTDKNGNPIATPLTDKYGHPIVNPLTDKNGNPIATPGPGAGGQPTAHPLTDKNGNPIATPGPGSGGQPTAQPLTDKNGNPIATPLTDKYGNPIATPLTDKYGNPIATPGLGSGGQPTAQPLTDKYGNPIATPHQGGSGHPTVAPSTCSSKWSSWINKDNPNVGDGEREFMTDTEKAKFCGSGRITKIECITADGGDIPYYSSGEIGTTCDVGTGLTCLNANNFPMPCSDYKVRYYCDCPVQPTAVPGQGQNGQPTPHPLTDKNGNPIATPGPGAGGQPTAHPLTDKNGNPIATPLTDKYGNPIANPVTDKYGNPIATPSPGSGGHPTVAPSTCTSKWSGWINKDNPNVGDGEREFMTDTEKAKFCGSGRITKIECITADGGDIPYYSSGEIGTTCDVGTGLTCLNANNFPMPCSDYKVRYYCDCPVQPTAVPGQGQNGQPTPHPLTDKNGNPIATPGPGAGGQPTAHPLTDKNGNPIATPGPGSGGQPTAQPLTDKNGNPIATPLTDKYGNPIANPVTDKYGNPIATPSPGSGGQPTAQPLTDKNGNPIATPLTDKYGNPIVNPLTDKYGNPIATPSPGSGGQPTAAPSTCTSKWSGWINKDNPNVGDGEREFMTDTEKAKFCGSGRITKIECITADGGDIPYYSSGEIGTTCDVGTGLTCLNANNFPMPCSDYKVRYYCDCPVQPTAVPGQGQNGQPTPHPLTDKNGNPIATPGPGAGGQPTAHPLTDKNGNPIATPGPGSGGQPTAQPLTDKNGNPIATPLTDKYGNLIANPVTDKYGNPIATPSPGSGGQPTAQPLTDKNGNPIATPLTDKYGNPIVNPLTDKYGNPIATPSPGSGGQPTAAPSTCTSKWSGWINKDNPNVGDGEREFMTDTEKAKFCGSGRITKIECITADGGDIPYYSSGEIGTTCDVGTGLTCLNANNFPMPCSDYKVRYYCDCPVQPTAVPGQGQNGQPTPHPLTDKNGNPIATPGPGSGGQPTAQPLTDKNGNPIATPLTDKYGNPIANPVTDKYGNPIATPSPGSGGQPTVAPSTCTSKWSGWINKDNPNVGDGEREFMTDTEKANFCGSGRITKIECITADGGDIPYYSSGEIGTTCDVGTGLTCLNANNFPMPCSDYKVRYYCDCPVQPTAVPGQGHNGQPTAHPQTDKNGNPIATPGPGSGGQPTAQPLTDKYGNPIATPHQGASGHPTVAPSTCSSKWSSWINKDNPNVGDGEREFMTDTEKANFCGSGRITKIECITADGGDIPYYSSGEIVQPTVVPGQGQNGQPTPQPLTDKNGNPIATPGPGAGGQPTAQPLTDKYGNPIATPHQGGSGHPTVAPSTCSSKWSSWINKDNPNVGDGEREFMTDTEKAKFCGSGRITKIECITADGGDIPYYSSGEIGTTCDVGTGLTCLNANNFPMPCSDYKVRYYCDCPVQPTAVPGQGQNGQPTAHPLTDKNGNPIATPGPGAGGQPTAQPLTDKYGNPIATPHQGGSGHPTVAPSTCSSKWSSWINKDNPNVGDGEREFMTDTEKAKFCGSGRITKIECITADGGDIPYYSSGEIGTTCDVGTGLTCLNANNFPMPCSDYKVRYYCDCPAGLPTASPHQNHGGQPTAQPQTDQFGQPLVTPQHGSGGLPTAQPQTDRFGHPIATPGTCSSKWSSWINKDNPNVGDGEREFMTDTEKAKFCGSGRITKIECITADGGDIPYYSSGEIGTTCDVGTGLTCLNANNFPLPCSDYKVRYYCDCPAGVPTAAPVPNNGVQPTAVPATPLVRIPGKAFPELFDGRKDFFLISHLSFIAITDVCKENMGMENHQIRDHMITASSYRDLNYAPKKARPDSNSGWMAAFDNKNQFIQVDFLQPSYITGVTTQGRVAVPSYVTSYFLFSGNFDSMTPVTHFFTNPIRTQFIRINPQSWYGKIALRFEIHGCYQSYPDMKTPPPMTTLAPATPPPLKESCYIYDQWVNVGQPTPANTGDIEPIAEVKKQSHVCLNPVKIECQSAAGVPFDMTGQIVRCNLWEGLVCNNADQSAPKLCYDYRVRLGCLKIQGTVQGSVFTTGSVHQVSSALPCFEGMDTSQCPASCPAGQFCDGMKCVVKEQCTCNINGHVVRPNDIVQGAHCDTCRCISGEAMCVPKVCPACTQGEKVIDMATCTCSCKMCSPSEYRCGSGECIASGKRCDGVIDCTDDEVNCSKYTLFLQFFQKKEIKIDFYFPHGAPFRARKDEVLQHSTTSVPVFTAPVTLSPPLGKIVIENKSIN